MPDQPKGRAVRPRRNEAAVTSGYGANTRQPFVELRVNDSQSQMTPAKAREIALMLFAAADAAESDGFIVQFFGREARLAEYAPSVVKRACQLLARALLEAYERGALPRNPARNLANFAAPTTHSRPLSSVETQALAAAAPHYHSGIAILCAVRLGLRVGEALGLQWRDYDPIRRTLTIERQVTARRAVAPPKYGSARVLPVPPALTALLDERRPDVAAPFAHLCTADDSDLPIRYDNARRALRTVLRAAGLSATVTTWHGLRHTLGARLTELGANEATIAAVLGHRGKSVTARYSHADVESMRRWIDAAEGMEEARQQQKVGS